MFIAHSNSFLIQIYEYNSVLTNMNEYFVLVTVNFAQSTQFLIVWLMCQYI